jgi:Thiolase, C-terminal domain
MTVSNGPDEGPGIERLGVHVPRWSLDRQELARNWSGRSGLVRRTVINYEDLGLADKGEGRRLVLDGVTGPGGWLPVNTSGGLQSCGHPIGASGVRMVIDVAEPLLGRCEAGRQVPDAELGLAHALGGPGSVASVAIVARPERTSRSTGRN